MALHEHQKHCLVLGAAHTAGAVFAFATHGIASALPDIAAAVTYFHIGSRGDRPRRNERRPDSDTAVSSTATDPREDARSDTVDPAAADHSADIQNGAG
jgi:hypothetical protein